MTGGKKENGRIVSCESVSVHIGSAQILHQTEQTEKRRKTENVQKSFFKHENVIISKLQSTLVISKSKGPSKTVRDIRTSTYQICSIEEKTIGTTKFYK